MFKSGLTHSRFRVGHVSLVLEVCPWPTVQKGRKKLQKMSTTCERIRRPVVVEHTIYKNERERQKKNIYIQTFSSSDLLSDVVQEGA